MTADRRLEIIKALEERHATAPCPRCSAMQFDVIDETHIAIQSPHGGILVGGKIIPVVIVVCTNCGFVSQHATLAIGTPPKKEASSNG